MIILIFNHLHFFNFVIHHIVPFTNLLLILLPLQSHILQINILFIKVNIHKIYIIYLKKILNPLFIKNQSLPKMIHHQVKYVWLLLKYLVFLDNIINNNKTILINVIKKIKITFYIILLLHIFIPIHLLNIMFLLLIFYFKLPF